MISTSEYAYMYCIYIITYGNLIFRLSSKWADHMSGDACMYSRGKGTVKRFVNGYAMYSYHSKRPPTWSYNRPQIYLIF